MFKLNHHGLTLQVSRVITGSVTDQDGRVQKRDRVLWVQGQKTSTMTPGEARQLLKAPASTVQLVVARKRFDEHAFNVDPLRRSIQAEMEVSPERQWQWLFGR
jgi:C-terminal processing protease CtpA/Prc